jgi:hypothetical protein
MMRSICFHRSNPGMMGEFDDNDATDEEKGVAEGELTESKEK